MITGPQKEKIGEFAAQKPIELVYLFGSQASGETKPYSDYDFAVLFDQNLDKKARFEERLAIISFLTQLLGTDKVDVIDLALAPPALRYEAIAPRVVIFTKSEDERVTFEQKSLAEYFDRLYYLRRHTQNSLPTIAREGLAR